MEYRHHADPQSTHPLPKSTQTPRTPRACACPRSRTCAFLAISLRSGSNHLEESESRPFALCPVDLRKLQSTIDASRLPTGPLDVIGREETLANFFEAHGLEADAAFSRKLVARMKGDG